MSLTVAGLVPFTTIDFPEKLAAVIFFQGCPLKCPYCHNPDLQDFSRKGLLSWEEVIDFLSQRTSRLDGVVFSGGEPLMQPEISKAFQEVKNLGYQIGIHTSGVYPDKIQENLNFIDWIGLDIKAPWRIYESLCGRESMVEKVNKTLKILIENDKEFEARTTCDPRFLKLKDIDELALDLSSQGVQNFTLQLYRTFEEDKNPPSLEQIQSFKKDNTQINILKKYFKNFSIRE